MDSNDQEIVKDQEHGNINQENEDQQDQDGGLNEATKSIDSSNKDDNQESRRDEPLATTSNSSNTEQGLRENLIQTAVDFLLIPKVVDSSIDKKKAFLRSKGLTQDEIDVAFIRANEIIQVNGNYNQSKQRETIPTPGASVLDQPHRTVENTAWSPFTRFTFSAAVISAVCYGTYQLYKRFIQPKVMRYFSERLDSIENKVDDVISTVKKLEAEKSGDKLQRDIESLLIKSSRPNVAEIHAINELRNEISSIKALLLSKNSFPMIPSGDSASIPSWQMKDDNEEESVKNGLPEKITNGGENSS